MGNEITDRIIGAAIAVHRALGPGFHESIYGAAFAIELDHVGLNYEREHVINIVYRDRMVGQQRLDFLVEGVVVELKSVEALLPIHTSQVISYLHALRTPIGLLINFNVPRLTSGIKRITIAPLHT